MKLPDVEPWGDPGRLHWFGLTSGRYWIETPVGEVLRYTPEIQRFWGSPSPYVDYQVARLLEDLEECLPSVLERVPSDIAAVASDSAWLLRVSHWLQEDAEKPESDRRWDLYDAALGWWRERTIDTAYLSHGPRLKFWRIEDEVFFKWEVENNQKGDTPVFLAPRGQCRIEAPSFQTEAYRFCEAVLSAMRHRIEQIQREGWQRTDCRMDIGELVSEQQRRESLLRELQDRVAVTDWDRVRTI